MSFAQGQSYLNALKYTGDQLADVPAVNFPRAPTTSDRNYPLFTLWRNSNKEAVSPDHEGDMWYLARFDATTNPYSAIWQKIATGATPGGTVISLSDTANTKVFSDNTGNIQLTAGSGITITSTPSSHLLTVAATNVGTLEKIGIDAFAPPGTNPVLPDNTGELSIFGTTTAAQNIPIHTKSYAANTFFVEAQVSSTVAPTPVNDNKVGLACFNNNQFQIDATSGMVSLLGSVTKNAILTINPDGTGEIGPDLFGNVNLDGTANQIQFSGAVNTITASLFGGAAVSSFFSYVNANVANVTGDGTIYNYIGNSTTFNIGGNYSTSTGQYTAPKTGKYLFNASFAIGNIGAGHTTGRFFIFTKTSGGAAIQTVEISQMSPAACQNADNTLVFTGSVILSMNATDTCGWGIVVNGSTKTISALGSNSIASTPYSCFSGELLV